MHRSLSYLLRCQCIRWCQGLFALIHPEYTIPMKEGQRQSYINSNCSNHDELVGPPSRWRTVFKRRKVLKQWKLTTLPPLSEVLPTGARRHHSRTSHSNTIVHAPFLICEFNWCQHCQQSSSIVLRLGLRSLKSVVGWTRRSCFCIIIKLYYHQDDDIIIWDEVKNVVVFYTSLVVVEVVGSGKVHL